MKSTFYLLGILCVWCVQHGIPNSWQTVCKSVCWSFFFFFSLWWYAHYMYINISPCRIFTKFSCMIVKRTTIQNIFIPFLYAICFFVVFLLLLLRFENHFGRSNGWCDGRDGHHLQYTQSFDFISISSSLWRYE